jgi:hypothetical protein
MHSPRDPEALDDGLDDDSSLDDGLVDDSSS